MSENRWLNIFVYSSTLLWFWLSSNLYIFADTVEKIKGIEKVDSEVVSIHSCYYKAKGSATNLKVRILDGRIMEMGIDGKNVCDEVDKYIGAKFVAYIKKNLINHPVRYQVELNGYVYETFENKKLVRNGAVFIFTVLPVIFFFIHYNRLKRNSRNRKK